MKIEINYQREIEFAAESLARILIQQAVNKKQSIVNKQIENRYDKSTK